MWPLIYSFVLISFWNAHVCGCGRYLQSPHFLLKWLESWCIPVGRKDVSVQVGYRPTVFEHVWHDGVGKWKSRPFRQQKEQDILYIHTFSGHVIWHSVQTMDGFLGWPHSILRCWKGAKRCRFSRLTRLRQSRSSTRGRVHYSVCYSEKCLIHPTVNTSVEAIKK